MPYLITFTVSVWELDLNASTLVHYMFDQLASRTDDGVVILGRDGHFLCHYVSL